MIPTMQSALPCRVPDLGTASVDRPDPKLLFEDMLSFARNSAPLPAAKPTVNNSTEDVENTTAACQENGASRETDCHLDDDEDAAKSDVEKRQEHGQSKEKQSDNSLLAAVMASCSNRDRTRVYRNFERAGLPTRELERLAYQLQQSAIAGSPKVSLGMALPELGEIRFDVQIAGKVVFIHAFVENDRAAAALALAVSSLRDKLEERNLVLGRLDVTSPSVGDRIEEDGHEEA